ncbi:hypothetical protein F485_gp176 [Aeromonas phage CC2]|uniref:Uncharacterized protein n=1 Tax=Aeromonas phage CC2 TaxID=1204516 RepID=I6WBB7_9CAUD|nr:hypothetical protein F485_gp176 [Aeromonas phage CC2]AFN39225.1 hypothetical protein CC2_119 [Aeromonas phage CC2]
MEFIINDGLYVALCALVSIGAHMWNRNWALWMVGSIVFSPVISGILLMVAGKKE